MLKAFLKRDLFFLWRQGSHMGRFACMFVITCLLFALGLGGDKKLLQMSGQGVMISLLAILSLLYAENFLKNDSEDGTLDFIFPLQSRIEVYIFSKAIVHWSMTGLPALICAPLIMQFFYIPFEVFLPLWGRLLIGSWVISLLSLMGAALGLGARRSMFAVFLIIVPLLIPVLILSATPLEIFDDSVVLWFMLGLLFFTFPISLWIGAKALDFHIKS